MNSAEALDVRKGPVGVVADPTSVSKVNARNNSLPYRGYPVQELAARRSFVEMAYLLWNGELLRTRITVMSRGGADRNLCGRKYCNRTGSTRTRDVVIHVC